MLNKRYHDITNKTCIHLLSEPENVSSHDWLMQCVVVKKSLKKYAVIT